jgi:four helix bundle protein
LVSAPKEASVGDYKRLRVWRKAHAIVCEVYAVTRTFPQHDQFVLGDQLRRAAISIAANIAEGCGRNGDGDLHRFLNIALGSANELRYLLELAIDVGVLSRTAGDPIVAAVDDVRRMLYGLASAADQGRLSRQRKKGTAADRAQSELRIADSG